MAKAKSLETAFDELEATIAALEDENLTLEDSFKLYTAGMKLAKYCSDTIDRVEKKMIELKAGDEENEF